MKAQKVDCGPPCETIMRNCGDADFYIDVCLDTDRQEPASGI
jgi:hypothetical protein